VVLPGDTLEYVVMISARQRHEECNALMDAASAARTNDEMRVAALRACVSHPCAYHELDLPELYGALGEALMSMKRYDESLEAWEAALAAGARGCPHPRANVADVLLHAGRNDEAVAVFADLFLQCPDDIWLCNVAGFSYLDVGDHASAIPWLERGIAMAMADGDREGILNQLDSARTRCRVAMGLTEDEISLSVAAFNRTDELRLVPSSPTLLETYGDALANRSPCAHCGWDPDVEPPYEMHLNDLESLADLRRRISAAAVEPRAPLRVSKVGRNSPCPCESGRKYKRCCGR
jgi:tetratricopeptide (TPR) repeat protein